MNALIVRHPVCGCLAAVCYIPQRRPYYEADGYIVTEATREEAMALPAPDCRHDSTQKQLAALVKSQAAEIEQIMHELTALRNDHKATLAAMETLRYQRDFAEGGRDALREYVAAMNGDIHQ